jgi:F-type H+-transporting ATPase subunit b
MLQNATFWLLVAMLVFLALVWKPGSKAITGMLDKRRDAVRSALEEAERLRAEAHDLLNESQRQHREAVQEAEQIIADAQDEAERIHADATTKLQQVLAAREAAALAKIAEAEAAATREARDLASQLALAASRDLLRQKLTGSAADALIDQAITDLPQKIAS